MHGGCKEGVEGEGVEGVEGGVAGVEREGWRVEGGSISYYKYKYKKLEVMHTMPVEPGRMIPHKSQLECAASSHMRWGGRRSDRNNRFT